VEWRLQRPRIIRGELTFAEALMEIGSRLNVTIDPVVIRRVTSERIRANREVFDRIDSGLLALTRHLHENGVRLAVISNCFEEDVAAWHDCAFAPQFVHTAFSFSVRLAKPDPEIYLDTTRSLGVDPEDALFVGDDAGDELLGAQQAGVRAVRVDWFVKPRSDHPAFATTPCLSNPRDLAELISAG
jgi:putative hydrolase of the HAD superfamily